MKIFKCNECKDHSPCFIVDADKDASNAKICPFVKGKPTKYIEVKAGELNKYLFLDKCGL